ncbi:hypothetical protein NKG05_06905 [Oerskovia sp. M15]
MTHAKERSGAADAAVQHFIAYGQLCHLLVAADIESVPCRGHACCPQGSATPTDPSSGQPGPARTWTSRSYRLP